MLLTVLSERSRQGNKMDSAKEAAFKKRLKDKGWGRAAAHAIPFYGIHYAITRRTLTPFTWSYGGTFLIAFIAGLILNPGVTDKDTVETIGFLIGLTFGPVFAKLGIDQSRDYAKSKLKEITTTGKVMRNDKEFRIAERFRQSHTSSSSVSSTTSQRRAQKLQSTQTAPKPDWTENNEKKYGEVRNERLAESGDERRQASPHNRTPEKLEDALQRYADLFKKGLIEKDEYDALRKRELGL